MHLCKIWWFSRVCVLGIVLKHLHHLFTEFLQSPWDRCCRWHKLLLLLHRWRKGTEGWSNEWGHTMRGKLELDLDPPTSKAWVLIITWNFLVQGEHFRAGGPITGEMLGGFIFLKKLYLLSLLHQGNAAAIDVLTCNFTLFLMTQEAETRQLAWTSI